MIKKVWVNQAVDIQDFWLLRGIKSYGLVKKAVVEKEFEKEPGLEEITDFLIKTKVDFVSVEHNFRIYEEDELPY